MDDPLDDVDAIRDALRGMLRGELADACAPRHIDRFVYPTHSTCWRRTPSWSL